MLPAAARQAEWARGIDYRWTVPSTSTPPRSMTGRLGERARTALALAALAVLVLLAVVPTVLRGLPFSVHDEATHLDLAYRDSVLDVPVRGDAIDDTILDAWACYGTESLLEPACAPEQATEDFPNRGSQYNFGHPPLYYLLTGGVARILEAATPLDFVTAARLTGAAWLMAGVATMFFGIRRLGADHVLAAVLAAAAGCWWTSIRASVYVTNDAPALAIAGGVVLLVAALARGSVPWVATTLLAIGAASTKVMNGLVVVAFAGACALIALVPAWNRMGLARSRLWLAAAGGVLGVVGVFAGWALYQSGRGDPDWQSPIHGQSGSDIQGSPIDEWLSTALDGFTSIGHATVTPELANVAIVTVLAQCTVIVVLAMIGIAWIRGSWDGPLRVLSLVAVLGLLAWPWIVQLQMFRSTEGEDFFANPSGRYGLTIPPLVAAAGALLAPRGRPRILVIAGCVVLVAITLVALAIPVVR